METTRSAESHFILPLSLLLPQVIQLGQQLIRHRNRPGICLEGALVDDQLHELGRQVDVRLLQCGGAERSEGARPWGADDGLSGFAGLDQTVVADRGQSLLIGEARQRDLGQIDRLAVRELAAQEAVFADGDALQRARGEAVLADVEARAEGHEEVAFVDRAVGKVTITTCGRPHRREAASAA